MSIQKYNFLSKKLENFQGNEFIKSISLNIISEFLNIDNDIEISVESTHNYDLFKFSIISMDFIVKYKEKNISDYFFDVNRIIIVRKITFDTIIKVTTKYLDDYYIKEKNIKKTSSNIKL